MHTEPVFTKRYTSTLNIYFQIESCWYKFISSLFRTDELNWLNKGLKLASTKTKNDENSALRVVASGRSFFFQKFPSINSYFFSVFLPVIQYSMKTCLGVDFIIENSVPLQNEETQI